MAWRQDEPEQVERKPTDQPNGGTTEEVDQPEKEERFSREEKGKGRAKGIENPEEKDRVKQESVEWGRVKLEIKAVGARLEVTTTAGAGIEIQETEQEAEGKTEENLEIDSQAAAEVVDGATEVRDNPLVMGSPKANRHGLLSSANSDRLPLLSDPTTKSEQPKRAATSSSDPTSAQERRYAASPSALESARAIQDLNAVTYPEAIKRPDLESNIGAPGKFRYEVGSFISQ